MIYLCDFEDSFTYNIFTECRLSGIQVKIIKRKEITFFLKESLELKEERFIMLGPGPGHPREYQDVLEVLKLSLNSKFLFFYGICLGHQLICEVLGLKVENSFNPIHGESVEIHLSKKVANKFKLSETLRVQRYNSLAVKMENKARKLISSLKLESFSHGEDLMGLRGQNFLSYQFHPESVGTTFRSQFFRGISCIES